MDKGKRNARIVFSIMAVLMLSIMFLALAPGCGGGGGGGVAASTPDTTPKITVTSNVPVVGFALGGIRYTTSNGKFVLSNPTPNTYSFACDQIAGKTVTANPISATVQTGGSVEFSCQYTDITAAATGTITVTPNNSGLNFVLSGAQNYSNALGNAGVAYTINNAPIGNYSFYCTTGLSGIGVTPTATTPTNVTLTAGVTLSLNCNATLVYPTTQTGTITISSNKATSFTLVGGVYNYSYSITTDNGSYTINNAPAISYTSFICNPISGYTVTTNQTSGTLIANGSLSFTCTYTLTSNPQPTSQTGTVTVRSNLNVANTVVTCGSTSLGHYRLAGREVKMDTLSGDDQYPYGYSQTGMPATTCTLTCPSPVGTQVLNTTTGSSVLSGTLTANGNLPLRCSYQNGGSGGGLIGPQ